MLKWAIAPDRGDQTTGDLRGRQCNAQAAGISSAKNDERPFKYPCSLQPAKSHFPASTTRLRKTCRLWRSSARPKTS